MIQGNERIGLPPRHLRPKTLALTPNPPGTGCAVNGSYHLLVVDSLLEEPGHQLVDDSLRPSLQALLGFQRPAVRLRLA